MRKRYFPVVSIFLLLLALFSFSDNLLTDVHQPSNHDIKFIAHGLFCLAWMGLFAVQANLAARANIRLHRQLGFAGIAVAAGVTTSTLYVFVAVWKGWDVMPVEAKANRPLLLSYAVAVAVAFLNRRRPNWHKRLMLVATLYMLEPVLSRAFDPFEPILNAYPAEQIDNAWWVFFVIVWQALFLSLFAYDWAVARRIHAVTIGGYAWFCLVWTVIWFV